MKHDEAKDVRLLSKVAKINPIYKTISIPANVPIGNKRWGRLDFLCHYCGYHLVRPDGTILSNAPAAEERRSKREKESSKYKRNNRRMYEQSY